MSNTFERPVFAFQTIDALVAREREREREREGERERENERTNFLLTRVME